MATKRPPQDEPRHDAGPEAPERESHARLPAAEARFCAAFDRSPVGMALLTPERRFVRVNQPLCRIAERTEERLVGFHWDAVTHPADVPAERERVRRVLGGDAEGYDFEKRWMLPRGGVVRVRTRTTLVRDERGRPSSFVLSVQEAPGPRPVDRTHDRVTGLASRTLLEDRLRMAQARARRHGTSYAVVFVDLRPPEPFTGRPGDAVLRQAAERITSAVRLADTAARVDDAFVIVCEDVAGMDDAAAVAARLARELADPFAVDGADVAVGATVGLTLAHPGDDPETLLPDGGGVLH